MREEDRKREKGEKKKIRIVSDRGNYCTSSGIHTVDYEIKGDRR